MRKLAKTVQFGIIYGMSPFGLSQTLSISDQEAKQFIEAYFFVYKGVQAYIHHTISEARQSGYVRTISGRMRPIPELASTRKSIKQLGERLAVNTTVQGSSADILKIAMIRLEKALPSDSGMVLTVHDEIVVETPKYEYEKVANLMKDTMEQAWTLSVPLSVHISIGTDLGELK
jgi:DNA polymerase-1